VIPDSVLRQSEAVPLAYALVDAVARRLGIRALAIKGPVLSEQGLRDPHRSVDVDVLIDPQAFDTLLQGMVDLGWVDTEPYELPTVMPRHSSTLRHPVWPCEVDLHWYFPGFLADSQVVFEALWADRSELLIANREVSCTSREASALVMSLHYLRDARSDASKRGLELLKLRLRDWPAPALRRIVELSVETGCESSAAPLLNHLGHDIPRPLARDGLADWKLRSETQTTAALAWWIDLSRAPWPEKPRRLRRAVWPGRDDAEKILNEDVGSPSALRQARWRRLRRGLRQVPLSMREAHRARRESEHNDG
jgi:hypothetical protein